MIGHQQPNNESNITDSDVSNIDKIQEAILNYIKEPETDFAVMISGEWGSGKTYFWKNILTKQIEKEIFKQDSFRKIIYISLYGIKNTKDIDNYIGIKLLNLFESLEKSFPSLNKLGEAVMKALKPVDYLHIINLAPVKDEILKLISEQNLKHNATNLILCFDDLERSKIDIETLLGHINQYVEHNHIKTIMICNESEIGQNETDNKKKEKYNKFKEKLVGYTYQFKPSAKTVVEQFIQDYPEPTKSYIANNIDTILNIVKLSQINNLRIIKNSLYISRIVFEEYQNKINEINKNNFSQKIVNSQIPLSIIHFICSINFELKTGKSEVELQELKEWVESKPSSRQSISRSDSEKDQKSYGKKFREKYYGSVYLDFTFPSIYSLIADGFFDKKIFSDQIDDLIKYYKSPKEIFINEYRHFSDDDFSKYSQEYIEDLKQNRISDRTTLLNIAELLLKFSQEGLINEKEQDIKNIFLNSIAELEKNNQSIENNNEFHDICFEDEDNKNKYYQEIKKAIDEAIERLKDKKNYEIANDLLKLMSKDCELFFKEIYQYNFNLSDIPILQYFNSEELFRKIVCLSNEYIAKFTGFIKNRYDSYTNIRDYLSSEYKTIASLSELLKNHVSKQDQKKLSIYLLKLLYEELGKVAEKLKPSQKTP